MTRSPLWQKTIISLVGLVLMILLSACAGVGTNGSPAALTGTITSVNAANHTVTISANGQTYTIGGLSDQEIQALQNQQGKTYTIQVTQDGNGNYSLTAGTNPSLDNNETPDTNETPSTSTASGSISFTGPVQNASSTSVTVKLPDGSPLTLALNAQSDLSDLNGAQLHAGQMVSVDAQASTTGFVVSKIKLADTSDPSAGSTIDFQGTLTQVIGSDHILHFTVGNRSFTYPLGTGADLSDFNGNPGSIARGTMLKVEVQFSGTTGTVSKISHADN